jgi:hypothetical protein
MEIKKKSVVSIELSIRESIDLSVTLQIAMRDPGMNSRIKETISKLNSEIKKSVFDGKSFNIYY